MPTHALTVETLPGASPGTTRTMTVHRFGGRTTPLKAYLQAGLHADEAPGFLVMHHLMARLEKADAEDAILGEIVLVPVANPIGSSQWREDRLQGRFAFWNGVNFNRNFPDLADPIAEKVADALGDSPVENSRIIRAAARAAVADLTSEDEATHLKHRLLALACDADIVLDLHCDDQAVLHVYMGESLWPRHKDLPAQLGARATLLADDSGVTPFDEACSRFWIRLAARFPERPIPPACMAATVELRGIADLSHARAARDADNLMAFLTRRGLIRGALPELPPLPRDPTPLTGVAHLKAAHAGVVVFLKEVGEEVQAGDVVAEVIDPLAGSPADGVHPLVATTDGLLFARNADRFARPGRILAKVAGQKPLKEPGENLLTQ